MSITTRTGDTGETSLMFGRRVGKNCPQVAAYGEVDELSASLGLVRAAAASPGLRSALRRIQEDLIVLMGELAVLDSDRERYHASGRYPRFTSSPLELLDRWCREAEATGLRFEGWALPGDTPGSAALDFARTVCRRAERAVLHFRDQGGSDTAEKLAYLNRLSDLLWLWARCLEQGKLQSILDQPSPQS